MAEIARITLQVIVHLEREEGHDSPITGRELAYDYVAVRAVDETAAELVPGPNPNALALGYFDGFEDLDPDTLLVDAVKTALFGLVPDAARPHDEPEDMIELEGGEERA